jgi:hypothetical protein
MDRLSECPNVEYCQKNGKKSKNTTGTAVSGPGENNSLMNEWN